MTPCLRGEVYLVRFAAGEGSEMRKDRPALVIQNDRDNRTSPVTIVAAFTSKKPSRPYPTNVLVQAPEGGLSVDSVLLLNQIQTINKTRLLKRLGVLSPATLLRVDAAIKVSLGLIQLP